MYYSIILTVRLSSRHLYHIWAFTFKYCLLTSVLTVTVTESFHCNSLSSNSIESSFLNVFYLDFVPFFSQKCLNYHKILSRTITVKFYLFQSELQKRFQNQVRADRLDQIKDASHLIPSLSESCLTLKVMSKHRQAYSNDFLENSPNI